MIERFINYIESERGYSVLTVRNYRRDVENFATWVCQQRGFEGDGFEHFDVTTLSAEDVRDWIIYRLDTAKLSAASMNRELSSLKSFFRYLRKIKAVSEDPFKNIRSLKTAKILPQYVPESRMKPLLLEVREQSRSSEFREQRDGIIISLLYGCGIRLAELLKITLGDISDGAVKIQGKGSKERLVPLLPELEARIARYTAICRENGVVIDDKTPLIFGKSGKALSRTTVQRIVMQQMSSAGIQGRKSPHVLRHTFATAMVNHEAGIESVKKLLGHESISTTEVYTHLDRRHLRSVVEDSFVYVNERLTDM